MSLYDLTQVAIGNVPSYDGARQFDGDDATEWRRQLDASVADLKVWLDDDSPSTPTPDGLTHCKDQRAFYRTFFR